MTAIVRTGRFRAAIAASAVGDLVSFYGDQYGAERGGGFSSGRVQWAESGQGGMQAPPWERPLRYVHNSPVFFLDRIRTPLLLIAGGEDAFCSWLQSGEVFTGLRRLGRECVFLLYPREGHVPASFSEPNRRDVVDRVLRFLEQHLGPPAPGC